MKISIQIDLPNQSIGITGEYPAVKRPGEHQSDGHELQLWKETHRARLLDVFNQVLSGLTISTIVEDEKRSRW